MKFIVISSLFLNMKSYHKYSKSQTNVHCLQKRTIRMLTRGVTRVNLNNLGGASKGCKEGSSVVYDQ